jgi:hypothetical protein
MVRIRFQCPLVPDLRELVVAELTIGVADQVGHLRVIVVAERLKLLDRGSIVVAIIDRRIGRAIPLRKKWDRRCWSAYWPFWPADYGWLLVPEVEGGDSPTPPPPPPAAKA